MAKRRPSRGVDEGLLRPTPRPDGVLALDHTIAWLVELDAKGLCLQSRNRLGGTALRRGTKIARVIELLQRDQGAN